MPPDAEGASAQPAAEVVVAPPSPVSTEREPVVPEAKPAPKPAEAQPEKKAPTTRDALKAAAQKVNAADKADSKADALKTSGQAPVDKKPGTEVKPNGAETKVAEPQNRAADGKFAGKEGAEAKPADATQQATSSTRQETGKAPTSHAEPPARFSAEAKAAWASAPEPVQAEVHRAVRELEAGHAQYREAAQGYETFRPFVDLAKRSNIDPANQLANYVAIDQMLAKDFAGGLDRICQNYGTSLRQVVQKLAGQPGDAGADHGEKTARELRQEIATLKQTISGIMPTIEGTRHTAANSQIEQFRGSLPEADRHLIDDLDQEIGALIANNGLSLPDAFAKAKHDTQARYERLFGGGLKPQPQPAPAPQPVVKDLTAQTLKGSKSITGAPGSGSDPNARKPSSSTREALRRAMASVA